MKKVLFVIIAILLHISFVNCQTNPTCFPVLKGPYLGQKPSETIPEIFAPNFLHADSTWFWHCYPSFSFNLKEIYFIKYLKGRNITELYYIKMIDNVWKSPEKVSFTKSEYRDNNPSFWRKDTLYFYSTRFGGSVCRVTRKGDIWAQPSKVSLIIPAGKNLGKQFSITTDGIFYAELWNNDDSDADIYRWKLVDGRYSAYEKLNENINSPRYDFMPFIEPNERYLLFCRQSPEGFGKTDIYISFRNANGTWTKAINMGSKINTPEEEGFPSISYDGKYFFFCREGKFGFNPYWVSSKIIEEFRPKK